VWLQVIYWRCDYDHVNKIARSDEFEQ